MCGIEAVTPSQTALVNRCWLLQREAKSSDRAGSPCCVRDRDGSREDSAATLIAGVVKVNAWVVLASPVPLCFACDRRAGRRKLIHEPSSRAAIAKHTVSEGVARRETLLTYVLGRRNIVAQVRRRARESARYRLITAARRSCDNLLTLALTSVEGRAYNPPIDGAPPRPLALARGSVAEAPH